jgi:GT2 family glycosyltransferase
MIGPALARDAVDTAFPAELVIRPISRWPTTLPEATVQAVYQQIPAATVGSARHRRQGGQVMNSIVIVTANNFVYTKLCLETLFAHTDGTQYEVIVIDNGSNDGTPDFLQDLASRHGEVSIISNHCNQGFARATNQGLARARGEFLVLLNDDTLVPPGWLPRLIGHLAAADIGLVGPCTNRSGNEAQIQTNYQTYGEFVEFARAYHAEHRPQAFDIRTATMFCCAMRRQVYEKIGPLDEQFEVGLFEDEDYAMRIHEAGLRVICAEDAFVHHFGQASIGKLASTDEYGNLFHANRRRWEKKWRRSWTPHHHRDTAGYRSMICRLRNVVYRVIPPGAIVLVASRGDEECVRFDGIRAWHFPNTEGGLYAGHHPADSAAAIAHLEHLRQLGAQFLVLPDTARWWLNHYKEFRGHLEARYRLAVDEKETCLVFALNGSDASNHGLSESILLDVSERATRAQLKQLDRQEQMLQQQIALPAKEDAVRQIAELEQTVLDQNRFIEQSFATLETALQRVAPAAGQALAYQRLVWRIRQCAKSLLPNGARVLVVSKGDANLLQLEGLSCCHFPQGKDGDYAGHHPADSWAAIGHLEALRAEGAQYLLIPEVSFWWLSHYPEFGRHLERHYPTAIRRDDACVIFDLKRPASGTEPSWICELEHMMEAVEESSASPPAMLDWNTGLGLAAKFPNHQVFSPPSRHAMLPYVDRSVDIIALTSPDLNRLSEARRIAVSALATFRGGSDGNIRVKIEWLHGRPKTSFPSVSIIIPCHNHVAFTERCLIALFETLPAEFRGEILVIDDASTDRTSISLEHWKGRHERLRVLRNQENLGFVRSCNKAAHQATGEFLVFLNNDTIPLLGWLPPLLRTFGDYPDAGAVGGKLIYPDGTLQEAGAIIFSDGSGANFGRKDYEVSHPLYEHVRPVDYCSGALLATPRTLFIQQGAFDEGYCPAYYEDADYCFKLRQAGYQIYYQPRSRIVHHEGATAGVDLTQGVKKHQLRNRKTFVRRWTHVLRDRPAPKSHFDQKAWYDLASRTVLDCSGKLRGKRAIVCSPTMPEFDRESGSQRIYDLIDFLQSAGWSVTFACKSERQSRYANLLQQRGVATYAGSNVANDDLITTGRFDLAVLAFWHVAEEYLPLIRSLSPDTRVLVDSIDLHFVRNARRSFQVAGDQRPGLLDRNYGSELIRELNAYAAADGVLAVSQKEADLVNDLAADRGLAHHAPDGEILAASPVPFDDRKGILFVGNFKHPPNVVAVEKLCTGILPYLDHDILANHPVLIVGHGLNEKVRRFAEGLPHVHMVGWVPSLVPYLHSARITVVPLSYGAGTKRKLIQALMAGTPTVSTSTGVEGLDLINEEHVLVADDPQSFAQAVARLLHNSELWHRLARHGRERIAATHGREIARTRFLEAVTGVMAKNAKKAPTANSDAQVRREQNEYAKLVQRIKDIARTVLPDGAKVLVVSKGDENLLDLGRSRAWHFPRTETGAYAGHHPADSGEAIRHLEGLRTQGASHLLVPATAFWWSDYYPEFREHLADRHRLLNQDGSCLVYELLDTPLNPRKK